MRYLILLALALAGCSTTEPQIPGPPMTLSKAAIEPTTDGGVSDDNFTLHSSIVKDLGKFQVWYRGANLIKNISLDRVTQVTREFRSFHLLDHRSMRLIVRLYDNVEYVDFWVYVLYGHTDNSAPTYPQEREVVMVANGAQVNEVVLNEPQPGKRVGHGQGLPVKFFRYYFHADVLALNEWYQPIAPQTGATMPPFFLKPSKPKWITDPVLALIKRRTDDDKTFLPFEQTDYIYTYPPQTGDQGYFGCYHTLPEIYSGWIVPRVWREQLYMEGCRPGSFIHPDGRLVKHEDYPNLVLSNFIHEKSRGYRDEGWIKHTHPDTPWRDKMAFNSKGTQWSMYDSQHWGVGPICQVYQLTDDPGLALIIEHLAEKWMFANPIESKGTTHHYPGAARAQGRVIEAGANLYFAHRDPAVKARIKAHLMGLVRNQFKAWDERKAATGSGLVARKDGLSVWEHALWVKGLAAMPAVIDDFGMRVRMSMIAQEVGTWVLDGFKKYGNRWSIPYIISHDGKTWSENPSDGLAQWCIPALQLMDMFARNHLSEVQAHKLDLILKQWVTDVQGQKNVWGDDHTRWRLK